MSLYRKTVRLKNFDFYKDVPKLRLPVGMEAQHKKLDNNEAFATYIHNSKEEINNKLAELPILSDRVRTLNQVPKCRIINTKVERIQ